MPLRVVELAKSREIEQSVDSKSIVLNFVAYWSNDENAVATALLLVAPVYRDGLRRNEYKCHPQGGGVWHCDVTYSWNAITTDAPATPGDNTNLGPEFSFDTTAGTAHITQSLATRYKLAAGDTSAVSGTNLVVGPNANVVTPDGVVPAGGDVGKILLVTGGTGFTQGAYTVTSIGAGTWGLSGSPAAVGASGGRWSLIASGLTGTGPDYKQAIGVTRDSVAGTDVFTPKFEFTISTRNQFMTLPRIRQLRAVGGKTNSAAWRGFAAGEVLYLGATGRFTPDELWNVTHKFAVGENLYAIPLSPTLTVPFKGAWEYLWCAYVDDVNANLVVQVPRAAYVEQVYRSADFTLLGLGG